MDLYDIPSNSESRKRKWTACFDDNNSSSTTKFSQMQNTIKKAKRDLYNYGKRANSCTVNNNTKRHKVDTGTDNTIVVDKQRHVVNESQQISWPMFRYFPISTEWQNNKCTELGLQFVGPSYTHRGSGNTILTRPDKRSIKKIFGDGFRSLSYVLTGSEDQHYLVRSLICNHMVNIAPRLLSHIYPHESVHDYITSTGMERNSVWGTDVEIFTFANICQINVYTFSTEHDTWQLHSPTISIVNANTSIESVYLYHSSDHYTVVRNVKKMPS